MAWPGALVSEYPHRGECASVSYTHLDVYKRQACDRKSKSLTLQVADDYRTQDKELPG